MKFKIIISLVATLISTNSFSVEKERFILLSPDRYAQTGSGYNVCLNKYLMIDGKCMDKNAKNAWVNVRQLDVDGYKFNRLNFSLLDQKTGRRYMTLVLSK